MSESRARFDRFQVDLSGQRLQKSGINVPIQAKPFQVLRLLLMANGEVVTREELRVALWPEETFGDFEHGVNTAVKKLRQALGDLADRPQFIETVPKIGYRFIEPVEWIPNERSKLELHSSALASPIRLRSRLSATMLTVAGFILAMLAVGIAFWRSFAFRPHLGEASNGQGAFRESPLTANPDDAPVTSSAISADGKLLAYSDPTGLYVRHVDGGETHLVPISPVVEILVESWFPDGLHLLVSKLQKGEGAPGLWKLSIMGGSPQMLYAEGESASLSPDGSQIVFVKKASSGEEVWLMRSDGTGPTRIIRSAEESFSRGAWSPDGKHFAYARTKTRYYAFRSAPETQIEIFDLARGTSSRVQDTGPRGVPRDGAAVGWLPNGWLLYPVREPRPNQQDTNLWSIRLDSSGTHTVGSPVRVTSGKGIAVQLSFSVDGKRLALRRHNPQSDIYVADVKSDGKSLGVLRRLTLDERLDYAMDWTPDNKSVIFYSNRDGPFHVYKQSIDATQPDLLVGGSDDLYAPRMATDGKSVIYIVRAKPGAQSDDSKIMRVPLAGGPPSLILEVPQIWDVECPRTPAGARCIYAQTVAVEGKSGLKVFSFRPDTGQQEELPAIEAKVDNPNFIFSHDGQYVAWQCGRPNTDQFGVRIASTGSDWTRFIPVPHWSELHGIDWGADSKALWVCARDRRGNSELLNVSLQGSVSTVLSGPNLSLQWAVPSFDGHHLAIVKDSNSANAALLEAF